MDADQPGLFDLHDRERSVPSERSRPGRNRETWTRTVTAEVTLTNASAVREAAARSEEDTVTIGLLDDPDVEDTEHDGYEAEGVEDGIDALARLIWPTDGLEGPLEAGALTVLTMDIEATADSVDRGTLTWTVTVKLTDVDELRRLAAQARPERAGLMAESLADAWLHAVDPYAPLRSIPGITWRPGQVHVEHRPARAATAR